MSEPLDEVVEVSWLEFFNRFDQHIYPAIFEPRHIPRETALLLWEISNLRNEVTELLQVINGDAT